ncbi:hypothetical protein QAD02_009880 [Eretmocerus hayati]|uniref:Uncharacterized protein n=1 Tax=Eretmocerus hayati TaxID=131215 RepID=A0ACC2NCY3_9HYME|nr:hypothetical protein QAD02_009880 [Eretmocerus hayati]
MNEEDSNYNVAGRYRTVRKNLDAIGYKQAFSLDSLPLIELLLVDLAQTKESLKHFQSIAQDNLEACDELQLAVEPYKCDNARLVQECNQLHLELIEAKETIQKQSNDYKRRIRKLESELSGLQLSYSKSIQRLKLLEKESSEKSKKTSGSIGKCSKSISNNVNKANKRCSSYPLRRSVSEAEPLPTTTISSSTSFDPRKVELHDNGFVSKSEQRISDLIREVDHLKEDLCLSNENIESLKSQLNLKDKEMSRLRRMLEGGRPCVSVIKDHYCSRHENMNGYEDLHSLQQAKLKLELELKEALNKQHDAMTQAMKLAERNEELENELKNVDRMALRVEADCNSTVKENNRRVCRLQEKLEDVMTQVHVLESELTVQRREAQELRADLEACRLEKSSVQRTLETTLEEKKQMTDRINNLTLMASKNPIRNSGYQDQRNIANSNKSPRDKTSNDKPVDEYTQCNTERLLKEKNVIIDSLQNTIERLESERDHYKSEYDSLRDQSKRDSGKEDLWSQICELRAQMSEKENAISKLLREKKELFQEKYNLENQSHSNQNNQRMSSSCNCRLTSSHKNSEASDRIERLIHERDASRADVERLMEERDALRERLKLATEAHVSEQCRLRESLAESESRLAHTSSERRQLLIVQGGRKAALDGLDQQLDDLKDELQRTKLELTEQRTQYFQLRALQDQTDQALSDVQGQLSHTENELSAALDRNKNLQRQQMQLDNQVKELRQEISNYRSKVAQIDREKDQLLMDLDEKTEKIAALEREIVFKEQQMTDMEQQVRDLSHTKQ